MLLMMLLIFSDISSICSNCSSFFGFTTGVFSSETLFYFYNVFILCLDAFNIFFSLSAFWLEAFFD